MVSLRATALSFFLVLGFIAACGDSSTPDPVKQCDSAGDMLCEGACVSIQSDPEHCGACDNSCGTHEDCEGGVCVAFCEIDGEQVAAGTMNAANACEQCTPATSSSTWTARADGTQCASGQVCSAGVCSAKCFIDRWFYDAGAPNLANVCEVCVPEASTTAWTPRADGTQCGSGQVCSAGTCSPKCFIDGGLHAAGAPNPANACEVCVPETSTTAWTPRADGTQCDSGQVCSAGMCSPKCFIDGGLHAAGAPNPANACEVCAPETSTTAWTAAASIPLLVGGEDLAAQGWTTVSQAPSALTYGADYVSLATSTNVGGRTSGQLLIVRANAVDPTKPFTLRVTMQVESVNAHNSLDSGAAIMGSFTPSVGNSTDRAQMIYLDSAKLGWADDTQSAAFAVTDGAYHVYELAVDAAKLATVSVDGVAKLTRNNFTTTGTIAIGDQTNDANVDGTTRIKSVERLCH
ncbi:hypothetical protein [Corallococcus silvisoli]|uniref:hypothetical protein n=1 Tax=Corallococcus silvisoli TaxID=2697031 RepID=UPI001376F8F6|nr:hypothetical protein [Corallococcus silvisoli]NBD08278.1 hypothetical protein [Corallococcus silvisoli]